MSFDLGESIDDWDSKSIGNCSETALVCPVEHAPVIAMATREFHLIAHFFPLVAGSNRKLHCVTSGIRFLTLNKFHGNGLCPEIQYQFQNCTGTALELHWGYQWNTKFCTLQSKRKFLSRTVIKLLWNCTEIALELHWNCTETARTSGTETR